MRMVISMSNIEKYPKCHMRTSLGNCDPIGGFCTSVNESICEALHKVSRPTGEWIRISNDWIDGTCGARYFPIRCSVCGYSTYDDDATKFCPNCGSFNGGEEE